MSDESGFPLVRAAHATPRWSAADSEALYRFREWGLGYFGVSDVGNATVHPEPGSPVGIPLMDIVEGLGSRELHTPLLLRFSGILAHRLRSFRATFDETIASAGYRGRYRLLYPIKVNQQRHVCEEIRQVGRVLGFGFEVGSKPELVAALALTADAPEMPIVCNGFKDDEYLELVLLACKVGRPVIPIIERLDELRTLEVLGQRHEVTPTIGLRARLNAQGSGRWCDSSGMRGKFGLSGSDIMKAVRRLEETGRLGSLKVLHCHVGSQVREIAALKTVVGEMAHLYVELRKLGAPVDTVDFGGGLAVDYDGTRTASDASTDYGLPEYVADLIYRIMEVCDDAGEPHPDILTESGRATVAYGSVLIVDVLGRRSQRESDPVNEPPPVPGTVHRVLRELRNCVVALEGSADPNEIFHDTRHAWEEAEHLFSLGHLRLTERAECENLFWKVVRGLNDSPQADRPIPELHDLLAEQYYCNFSLFQSLPDSWAIDQQFPIAPIHRLLERPRNAAVLGDITCDSDGRIQSFVGGGSAAARTLPVHKLVPRGRGTEPYYLGVFLVGAYQETLGDLHNLLGDTHAVHIVTHEDGSWEIDEVVDGDTTEEVLRFVQYDPEQIRRNLRREIEGSIREGAITVRAGVDFRRAIENTLRSYTYLGPDPESVLDSMDAEELARAAGDDGA